MEIHTGAGTCSPSKRNVHLVLDEASRQKRIGVRFVPKGHLTIAHGFNRGFNVVREKVPEGRLKHLTKTLALPVRARLTPVCRTFYLPPRGFLDIFLLCSIAFLVKVPRSKA